MTQVLRGNIVHAPAMGRLDILEHGCLVLEDGVITGLYPDLPAHLEGAEVRDFGDRIIMQSFADMHLHAPQYPMLGMGMDLPLLDWLNTYTRRRHRLCGQGQHGPQRPARQAAGDDGGVRAGDAPLAGCLPF